MSTAKKSGSSKAAKKKPVKAAVKKVVREASKVTVRLTKNQLKLLQGALRSGAFDSCENTFSGTASCCGGTSWSTLA